ncbi:hypothetical protein D3C71_1939920 [compost metagenome]
MVFLHDLFGDFVSHMGRPINDSDLITPPVNQPDIITHDVTDDTSRLLDEGTTDMQ